MKVSYEVVSKHSYPTEQYAVCHQGPKDYLNLSDRASEVLIGVS